MSNHLRQDPFDDDDFGHGETKKYDVDRVKKKAAVGMESRNERTQRQLWITTPLDTISNMPLDTGTVRTITRPKSEMKFRRPLIIRSEASHPVPTESVNNEQVPVRRVHYGNTFSSKEETHPPTSVLNSKIESESDTASNHEGEASENLNSSVVGPIPMVEGTSSQFDNGSMSPVILAELRLVIDQMQEDLKNFVFQPVPSSVGDLQCRITRDSKGIQKGMFPTYYMHFERPTDGRKIFILSGRKRVHSTSATYIMSTDPTDMSYESETWCGKIKANILGTQFTVYDQGVSAKKKISPEQWRRELASIVYERNIFGFSGPRKMTVLIPATNDGKMIDIRPRKECESLVEKWKHDDTEQLIALHNKTPVWNDETQSYVLNFHGRVTQPSVKNFQLVFEHEENYYRDYVCLQFGRVDDDAFTCDFKYPLSPLQAFAIALSSLANKLACE